MIKNMDDFNFYLKFAKPLVLNLPDARDRTIAALWIKKLCEMKDDDSEANMRTEYLKLLLFVMQRNKLAGIFEKAPPEGPLDDFPPNFKATDMLSLIKPRRATPLVYPPVLTSVGGDLCEFVAVQEIPNFGLHGYYAISTEPLPKWSHARTNAAKKLNAMPDLSKRFKDTYELIGSRGLKQTTESPYQMNSHPQQSSKSKMIKFVDSKSHSFPSKTEQTDECENLPSSTPLSSIPFQSYKAQVDAIGSRPTWGRSRYVERLVDESPHLVSDLDTYQADAMLNVMSDKKFKRVERSNSCLLSERRRHVERMLDLPPCAADPGETKPDKKSGPVYSCYPNKDQTVHVPADTCFSEHDLYTCRGSTLSLHDESDDDNHCESRGRSYPPRMTNNRKHYTPREDSNSEYPQPRRRYQEYQTESEISRGGPADNVPLNLLPKRKSRSCTRVAEQQQAKQFDKVFDETNDFVDVDVAIQKTTKVDKFLNADRFANFQWFQEMENFESSDRTDACDSRIVTKPRSLDSLPYSQLHDSYSLETDGCDEISDIPPMFEQSQPKELLSRDMNPGGAATARYPYGSQSRSPASFYELKNGSRTRDKWKQKAGLQRDDQGAETSMVVLRKRLSKLREATANSPEVHDKMYRWKEIVDRTNERQGQVLDPDYLDYIEAVKTDGENFSEGDDDDYEDADRPSHFNHRINQILDLDMARYTKELLKPSEVPRSRGKLDLPLSPENRRTKARQENRQIHSTNRNPETEAFRENDT